MADLNLMIQGAIPWILYIITILGAIVCLMQKDPLRMAVLTSVSGFAVAAIFQVLLAADVALTQAVVGAAIVPTLVAIAVLKTREEPVSKEEGEL
ncbi:MAG: DUF4040 domain-containing protein [Methanosphaera sp.]|uniref:DUF4040 domain-containing protein n=1 Tax=Methanosphaera sp. TaxID=2666342 RepID=UPI0025D64824|nr:MULTISPECIES: DUF4040 domain-containing protein [Methanobacteriaceae]MCI5866865.1 DUF4040 domain-containing protein [Methanosphaera sp.]MDD6534372.1 DUF4040 domain-containing protein [Methanosphaera sp.]MDY3955223.1 DUF4040 domain-containing protein [Methanosphaera sp.]